MLAWNQLKPYNNKPATHTVNIRQDSYTLLSPHGTETADPGFAKGSRADHGERAEREPITEVWGRSPQLGPGAEPHGGNQKGKMKAFVHVHTKEGPKVRPTDLNDRLALVATLQLS